MICPFCGHENIVGSDTCEACRQSLIDAGPTLPAKTGLEASIESDPLAALEPAVPVTVSPLTSVADVIQLLAKENIGCVLVVWCDALLGIFSERDALLRVGNRIAEVAHEPIRHFMTPAPETLAGDDSIAFALNRMAVGDFRHVPIQRDEKPVGVVSVRDMLGYLARQFPELGPTTG